MWNKLTHNAEQLYQINVKLKWNLNYKAKSKENPNNLREEKISLLHQFTHISVMKKKS